MVYKNETLLQNPDIYTTDNIQIEYEAFRTNFRIKGFEVRFKIQKLDQKSFTDYQFIISNDLGFDKFDISLTSKGKY